MVCSCQRVSPAVPMASICPWPFLFPCLFCISAVVWGEISRRPLQAQQVEYRTGATNLYPRWKRNQYLSKEKCSLYTVLHSMVSLLGMWWWVWWGDQTKGTPKLSLYSWKGNQLEQVSILRSFAQVYKWPANVRYFRWSGIPARHR